MSEEAPKMRDYRQYIIWQLVSFLRGLKVIESLTPLQQKLVESKADIIAATIREDVESRDQQIALEALYELRESKQSVPIHTGTDSARPGGYMQVVPVSSIDMKITELEATLKQAQDKEKTS